MNKLLGLLNLMGIGVLAILAVFAIAWMEDGRMERQQPTCVITSTQHIVCGDVVR